MKSFCEALLDKRVHLQVTKLCFDVIVMFMLLDKRVHLQVPK